jgi:F-type H+-transporting ATPase subunit delta
MAEKTTIARPYAQAIFDIAKEQGALKEWSAMLDLAANVAADPTMQALIDSPRHTDAQVVELFLNVCGDKLSDVGKSMIRVLGENKRLEAEKTIEAEVESATTLTDAQLAAISAALKARLGREVSFKCSINESLLGGAIIRAGDLVIDGSVVGKLTKLQSTLLH